VSLPWGAYYADGSRASGPPERGLFTYDYKIVNGQLQIDAGQMPTLSNTAKLVTIDTGQRKITMRILKELYAWLELRLQLGGSVKEAALHPVPRNTASWWYVFGSAAFTLLFLQIVTGILLAIVYVPSAGQAWNSLNLLNHQLELGWVFACDARVGIQLHGSRGAGAHGAGFHVRVLQVSA